MNALLAATATLALLAGAVSAADYERPDPRGATVANLQTIKVSASTVYSPEELARARLMADDVVEVTVYGMAGKMDMRSRDN